MSGKRVLIVDDAVVMRMMIKGILSKNGYEVVGEAQNGVEAVEKYRALSPDLVTMDMVMPEMDGITAVKQIVAGDPNARIIMCTSMGQQALVVEARHAPEQQAPRLLERLARFRMPAVRLQQDDGDEDEKTERQGRRQDGGLPNLDRCACHHE